MRTQVGIVGAGPAGLFLSHLLHRAGIESILIEARSRRYVEERVRAGVLEHGTVELMNATGVGERMRREGLVHRGIALRFDGRSRRIDFEALTGNAITVYGQHEVVKDMIAARLEAGARIVFDVAGVSVHDIESNAPRIRYTDAAGTAHEIACDFIGACDGFHGVCRPSIPPSALAIYERTYPFAWLGILSESPPPSHELMYTNHPRGFALFSARSAAISRSYLQCAPDENLAEWPDARIWQELRARLEGVEAPPDLIEGRVLQKGVTPMRSFVTEPMSYGRLFLAGDAAHIVPPTGAKGMNLAVADVAVLARALADFYATGSTERLAGYSETCLLRVWKAQRFSWWMTSMLHRFDAQTPFERRVQAAELDYVTTSHPAAQSLAENYVGLPMPA
ncbi:MAG: 4-hydroxybenzoate 3-monooxygenase [Candidatus Velthaea sp.]